MKKNRKKEGWVSISYNGDLSLEIKRVTKQCVKDLCEASSVKFPSGNDLAVLKDDCSDRFTSFCRESYIPGALLLLGIQFPVLREQQVKIMSIGVKKSNSFAF